MKALIYARQSSGKEDVSESVEAQIANCMNLARAKNLEVIGIYRDLNNSGELYPEGAEKIAEMDEAYQRWLSEQSCKKGYRKGLGELLKKIPETDILLVNEMTRLYRPVNHSFLESYIHNILKVHEITIIQYQGEEIDLRRFDQHLIIGMKNSILYEDLRKKRLNSINAFRIKRDSGKLCCGSRIFAIKYHGNDKISVDPEKGEIVRKIYSGILAGIPLNTIIRSCNRNAGKLMMYPSLLYSIASQPLYAGLQYNTNGELIRNVQITGQEIIPENEWFTVQKMMKSKQKKTEKKHTHWLPLSSRLICGICGSRLVCRIDHGKVCYTCNRQKFDPASEICAQSRIRFETGAHGEYALYDAVLPLLIIGLYRKYSSCSTHFVAEQVIQDVMKLFLDGFITKQELKSFYLQFIGTKDVDKDLQPLNIKKLILGQIRQITERKVSQELFEEYLYYADINIIVNLQSIEFKSVAGSIEIPRLWKKNRVWMPRWTLRMRKSDDESFPGVIICYETGKSKILCDFGKIRVITR